jgi:prepilin-type N-terminal cleavage/methylation domain-containing protein
MTMFLHRRRGVTLVEVAVAIVLVGALGSLILESQVSRSRQQRTVQSRELAIAEAGNLMERLTALPWNDLTSEKLASLSLSEAFHQALPGAKLQATVDPSGDPPESRRIKLEIDWSDPAGQPVRPVRLTSWVYRIGTEPEVEADKTP